MICTSCGAQIPESSTVYKCRQCVSHHVCTPCMTKEHNRASGVHHTLEKIKTVMKPIPPQRPSLTVTGNHARVESNVPARPTSIFVSKEYLTMFLGYCDHCLNVFTSAKDVIFTCDQCPNGFAVCNQCISRMPHEHPSMHTFSKGISHSEAVELSHNLEHLGVSCDGCQQEHFNGIRYKCERCESSYDLCEKCIGVKHKQHTFKIIPNPLLRAHNNEMLAKRTLDVIAKKGVAQNPEWRDPLTGWTKANAENMIKQSQQERDSYNAQLQTIIERIRAASKQQLEHQREMAAIQRDAQNFQLSLLSDNVLYLPRS